MTVFSVNFLLRRINSSRNVIGVLFPSSLTPVIIGLGPIPEDKVIHDISREERMAFGSLIKSFPFTITGLGGFSEAVITRGGDICQRNSARNYGIEKKMKKTCILSEKCLILML